MLESTFLVLKKLTARNNYAYLVLLLMLVLVLTGCKTEIYQQLTEDQANAMLTVLLKHNIDAQKVMQGKKGFSITVDKKQLVQALEILKENNLPGSDFSSLGQIFSGQGMISSPAEEQIRLAYAISQELADTFSRIDGVLTARVHVVPATADQTVEHKTPPSAGVFLRHLPDSPVTELVPRIRELTAKAVPNLNPDKVSVMLVPVREKVSVPMLPQKYFLGIPYMPTDEPPYILALSMLVTAVTVAGTILLIGFGVFKRYVRKNKTPKEENAME
ncbi:MAG: type III secretion inner membrane ring lipoprotein SctJ [Desulfomicrobium sp.]|nr:type III secretion inner membrane ring lipoprotein SctJ [Desulfomicrobium sp.]